MSFAAPLWLAAAALVGAGVLYAHLFSPTIPPQGVLPTVRFIPEGAPLTVLRSRRVSDWWLLILRLLAIGLLGLALAGAHVRRSAPDRVVVVDVSRAVGAMPALIDTALAVPLGARLIVFDSAARSIPRDSLRALVRTDARGSLSAALVAAHRLVAAFPDDRNRTELVIVSPLAREEVDSATSKLLELWEGPVRVVRAAAATAPARRDGNFAPRGTIRWRRRSARRYIGGLACASRECSRRPRTRSGPTPAAPSWCGPRETKE